MNENILELIKEQFTLNAIEVGEYERLKANGMTFCIRQYYAKGLGNVTVR